MKTFKDLILWQKSVELAKEAYRLTANFPKEELYGLVSQIRRSAISIPSNVAEGSKRKTGKESPHFLRIANGSAAELETQIIITKDLYPHLDFSGVESLLEEVQKMLVGIINKLDQ